MQLYYYYTREQQRTQHVVVKQTQSPAIEAGNVCVKIDEDKILMGLEENKYSLIGRILSQKRDEPTRTL